MRWYWPRVTDLNEAKDAAYEGAAICFLITIFTAAVATASLWLGKPILGIDGWAFIDALIFAIAGWRISRLSRTWAVLALAFFIAEKIYMIEVNPGPPPTAGILVAVGFTLALIGGVRGTFGWHAFKKKESAAATVGAIVDGTH